MNTTATTLSWFLFAMGVGHIGYGFVRFKAPLLAALSAGVVGQFSFPENRRCAFWFTLCGPMIMLAGQVAAHAASGGDVGLYRMVSLYVLGVAAIGLAAFPKSPFLVVLPLSAAMVAAGQGVI